MTVGGDNHAAQRAYGSHQAGAFFYHSYPIFVFLVISNSLLADKDGLSELVNALIDSIRAMLALKFQYWLKFGRDSDAEF